MTVHVPGRRSLRQIFLWPAVIAAVSVIGLVAALVADGVWDAVSWVALAIPNALLVYFVLRSRRGG